MDSVYVEIIKITPSVLWFSLAIFLVVIFYGPIRNDLLPNLTNLEAGAVKLSFVRDSMEAALEVAEKTPQWNVHVSSEDKRHAIDRARKHASVFLGAQVLWVDDHPENNINERKMFRRLGVDIDVAQTTDDAMNILASAAYDLILSDMARDGEGDAGLKFLKRMRSLGQTIPVIFYIGTFDESKGVPGNAFGITNRPDELLHLALDALERRRS